MALKINYNFQSDFTHANMLKNEFNVNKNLEHLATGHRINSAADDAAGLYIADQLKTFALSLDRGTQNAQDGVSLAQIAQGSMSEVYNILNDIKSKAIEAGNTTLDKNSRQALQDDVNKLADAIGKIFKDTKFNGKEIFVGTGASQLKIHYGAETNKTLVIDQGVGTATSATGTTQAKLTIGTMKSIELKLAASEVENTIKNIDSLIKEADKLNSYFGSKQIELEKIISNNETMAVNTRDAEGRIRNVDFAKEMADFTKNNILMQSGTAMLAQANQQSQLVLQLLR